MCNSVHYLGQEYSTPQDLAGLLGGSDQLEWQERNPFARWPKDEDWRHLDLCLCPVNLEKTLERAGFNWRRGDDPMEWHIERRNA